MPTRSDTSPSFTFAPGDRVAAYLQAYPELAVLLRTWTWPLAAVAEAPFAQVAAERGPADAHAQAALAARPHPAEDDPDLVAGNRDLDELVELLTGHHHAYTRAELGRLRHLLEDARARSGSAEIARIAEDFAAWQRLMLAHLAHEERELFPLATILARVHEDRSLTSEVIRERIDHVDHDHAAIESTLGTLADRIEHAVWPATCQAHRAALVVATAALAGDLAQHTYLEEEYLVPGLAYADELFDTRRQAQRRQRAPGSDREGN